MALKDAMSGQKKKSDDLTEVIFDIGQEKFMNLTPQSHEKSEESIQSNQQQDLEKEFFRDSWMEELKQYKQRGVRAS